MIKNLLFSLFIIMFTCSTFSSSSFPINTDLEASTIGSEVTEKSAKSWEEGGSLEQIFGGKVLQSWDPLAHKVVFIRGILDESSEPAPSGGTLIKQNRSNCSGVMIRPRLVLTAAHCFQATALRHEVTFSIQPNQLSASEQLLLDSSEAHKIQSRVVDQVIIHDQDDQPIDLAILKIETPSTYPYYSLKMTSFSGPHPTSIRVHLSGYGRSEKSGTSSDHRLRSVEVATQPLRKDDTEIIFDQRQGVGICSGDSGGPVFVYDNGEFKVIGINSYVFNYSADQPDPETCRNYGSAIHLGPYQQAIQKAIEQLEVKR